MGNLELRLGLGGRVRMEPGWQAALDSRGWVRWGPVRWEIWVDKRQALKPRR